MAKVPNGEEKLPKISTGWVGRTNVTDDRRQTDRRNGDYTEREREFTFAKKTATYFQKTGKLGQKRRVCV